MTTEIPMEDDIQRILQERARELARTGHGASTEDALLRLLAFSVGEERFGVDMRHVREIQPLKREMWSLVPCTPDFIVGAVNIRGRIYSIMNVVAYLEINASLNMEEAHVLLVRGETGTSQAPMEFCILAEGRPHIEAVRMSSIQPATGTLSAKGQEFIQGVTADMLMILDLEKLISHSGIVVNDITA